MTDFKPMGIWLNDKKPENLSDLVGNIGICNILNKYVSQGNPPNLLFIGEHGVGKRTIAGIFAKTYLGEDYTRGRLLIDGAINRGKDVISETVQDFARRRITMGLNRKKLIIITNFDSMTHEAQNALRRIMELESSARFIFTGNDTSEIIEAIQSRCTILRINGLNYDESMELIRRVTDGKLPKSIAEVISLISEGDMKRIINYCQTVSIHTEPTLEQFYRIFNIPPIKTIEDIIRKVHCKEAVFSDIDYLMEQGHNYNDVMDIIARLLAYRTDILPDDVRYKYLGIVSEHYCELKANTARLHMHALFSRLAA
jgi:DNA polymerase III delta prime subunit